MKRRFAIIGSLMLTLTLVVVMLATACGQPKAPAAAGKDLKIGVTFSYTGPASSLFGAFRKALDLQAEEINAAGGVTVGGQKYRVALIHADDQFTVEGMLTAFRKLVDQDNVKFLIGPSLNPSEQAIGAERDERKILEFDASSGMSVFKEHAQYLFKPHFNGDLTLEAQVKFIADSYPQAKRYAIVAPNDSSGQSAVDTIKRVLDGMKGRFDLVSVEMFDSSTTNFTPILTKVLAQKPDVLDNGMTARDPAMVMLRQARDLGFQGPYSSTYSFTKEEAEKAVGRSYTHDIIFGAMDWDTSPTPELLSFRDRFKAKYGEPPDPAIQYLVDHLPTMVKAIQDAGTLDTTKIKTTMESWSSYPTHFGPATWGGLQTMGVKHIGQRGGAIILVKSADDWKTVMSPVILVP